MHYHGAVLAGLCFMYRELAGAIVTELFTDAFAVHVVEAVFQYAARVPVAPDAVAFGFAVMSSLPKAFACHSATHAIRVKTAACLNMRCAVRAIGGAILAYPEFFVQKNVSFLNVTECCRILAYALFEIVFET